MKDYKVKKIKDDKITIQETKEKKSVGAIIYMVTMSISIILFLIVLGIAMSKMLFSIEPVISSEKLDIEITYDDDEISDMDDSSTKDLTSSDNSQEDNNKGTTKEDIIENVEKYNYIKAYINNYNAGEDLSFQVKNNTNKKYKYRIVIEESEKSTLKTDYIKYGIKVDNKQYKYNANINEKEWTNNSQLDKTTYILYESELDSNNHIEVELNIGIDYSLVNNNSQNKYWYGTIKVYAWEE